MSLGRDAPPSRCRGVANDAQPTVRVSTSPLRRLRVCNARRPRGRGQCVDTHHAVSNHHPQLRRAPARGSRLHTQRVQASQRSAWVRQLSGVACHVGVLDVRDACAAGQRVAETTRGTRPSAENQERARKGLRASVDWESRGMGHVRVRAARGCSSCVPSRVASDV